MLPSQQNAGNAFSIHTFSKSFENAAKFKYLESTLKCFIHEGISSEIVSTIWLESYFFSFLLPNNGKIKIQKNVAACILYACK